MTYRIQSGIQVSLDGNTWYKLTDHNRSTIQYSYDVIEKTARMSNGKMRKYVIDKKATISTSWEFIPSKTALTVDSGYSSEWLTAFYNTHVFTPIYLKVVSALDTDPAAGAYPSDSTRVSSKTGSKVYTVFISKFSKDLLKRTVDNHRHRQKPPKNPLTISGLKASLN